MAIAEQFSPTYAVARRKFLDAATGAGAWVDSNVHPSERGFEGELLATDVARFGPEEAENLLIVLSGTMKASAVRAARSASSRRGWSGSGPRASPSCWSMPSTPTASRISAG